MDISKQQCVQEIIAASLWWCSYVTSEPELYQHTFRMNLINALMERCKDHWYPENPSKGSGYRSVINDIHIDPILLMACSSSSINPGRLPGKCVQIISPGIVRIRSLINENQEQIIFQK